MEDKNRLFLLAEWDTRESLMTHLKSDHFKVIRGAVSLIKELYEMVFHTPFHLQGTQKIQGTESPSSGGNGG